MHTCPPPTDALEEWLDKYPSVKGTYGHLLLEQKSDITQPLIDAIRPYFESAHLDARKRFHDYALIELHPDATEEGVHAQYPNCLSVTAKSGLFGEAMIGMITEAYEFVGKHKWSVPVFLFRHHDAVKTYIYTLARDSEEIKETFGRLGSDFVGISLDSNGSVTRLIAGEAKWRNPVRPSNIEEILLGKLVKNPKDNSKKVRSGKGVWHQVNKDLAVPEGFRQLHLLLKELDPVGHAAAIHSMDKALLLKEPDLIPKTDLIFIIGNAAPTRKKKTALVPWENMPEEYTAGNDLQVVEVVLEGGDGLIASIYNNLWAEENSDASE